MTGKPQEKCCPCAGAQDRLVHEPQGRLTHWRRCIGGDPLPGILHGPKSNNMKQDEIGVIIICKPVDRSSARLPLRSPTPQPSTQTEKSV